MHPPHRTRDATAIEYLVSRDALWKLKTPVPCLFTGDQRHGEALRRAKRATASRSHRLAAWAMVFPFWSFNFR